MKEKDNGTLRTFGSGATRDTAQEKVDVEGFISPVALFAYGEYMLAHQEQSDGSLRASDNWAHGIPRAVLIKSLLRHALELWYWHWTGQVRSGRNDRDPQNPLELCCALLFNVQALLHELTIGRDTGEPDWRPRNHSRAFRVQEAPHKEV